MFLVSNYHWEVELILWLQNFSGEWLNSVMIFFTLLGLPPVYLLLGAFLYWCVDRSLGLRIIIFVFLTGAINQLLKQIFHGPRPYWVDNRINAIFPSTGFGMPSGHAQLAIVWLFISQYMKNKQYWLLGILTVFMIGISRAFLGQHFLSQIVIGWALGGLMLMAFIFLEKPIVEWIQPKRLKQKLLILLVPSVAFLILAVILADCIMNWQVPANWHDNAAKYLSTGYLIQAVQLKSLFLCCGLILGASVGHILINRLGGFDIDGTWKKRLLRFGFGILCLIALGGILFLLKKLFSIYETQNYLFLLWLFFCSFIVMFCQFFVIPVLFLKLKLANRSR